MKGTKGKREKPRAISKRPKGTDRRSPQKAVILASRKNCTKASTAPIRPNRVPICALCNSSFSRPKRGRATWLVDNRNDHIKANRKKGAKGPLNPFHI